MSYLDFTLLNVGPAVVNNVVFYSPIHSLLNIVFFIWLAFWEKCKINLENEKIYIFYDEFNKKNKKKILWKAEKYI